MDIISTVILGFLQGVTEFLPVSSSAHLVVGQELLGVQQPGMLMEVALHLGTLLSVVVYFRHDLAKLIRGSLLAGPVGSAARREVGYLALATLPAVVVALTLADPVSAAFENIALVGAMLLVTSVVLVTSRFTHSREGAQITWLVALIIGSAQAVAILPGISRSGITIVAGLWLGLGGLAAARFSFLMAVPAILGAGLLQLLEVVQSGIAPTAGLAAGLVVAAVTGYAVIAWLLDIIRKRRLYLFSGYTTLLGLTVIFRL
jgi:undecaprenyl-diphosphatase